MAYDEHLAARLADLLAHHPAMREQRMFGGIGWMLNGNMCVGVHKDSLILRLGPTGAAAVLQEDHTRPMDLTGRIMQGWVMVGPDALMEEPALRRYVQLAMTFVSSLAPKEKA